MNEWIELHTAIILNTPLQLMNQLHRISMTWLLGLLFSITLLHLLVDYLPYRLFICHFIIICHFKNSDLVRDVGPLLFIYLFWFRTQLYVDQTKVWHQRFSYIKCRRNKLTEKNLTFMTVYFVAYCCFSMCTPWTKNRKLTFWQTLVIMWLAHYCWTNVFVFTRCWKYILVVETVNHWLCNKR